MGVPWPGATGGPQRGWGAAQVFTPCGHHLRVVPGRVRSSLPRAAPAEALHRSHSARSQEPGGGSATLSQGWASGSPSTVWPACHLRPCCDRVRPQRQQARVGFSSANCRTRRALRSCWWSCKALTVCSQQRNDPQTIGLRVGTYRNV